MKKGTVFLLIFLMICSSFQLTANELRGKIMEPEKEEPLPGANVQLQGPRNLAVATNRDGIFAFKNLPEGKYTLRITYVGFETLVREIEVLNDVELNFLMERVSHMADEVLVSAIRAGSETPATFTNMEREEIDRKNIGVDLPFLLDQTPSVVVNSDAGAGVGYTGLTIRGSDITRINVTINGIPVNDSESHGVFWVNMPDIAASTENIQIQRGVGTSSHGAGAFGATINLQTNTLNKDFYAELDNGFGSFNTWRHSLKIGSGLINDRWSFDGRLSFINSDGYIDRASSDLWSYYVSGAYHGENSLVRLVHFAGNEKTYQAWYGVPSDSLETNRTYNPGGEYVNPEGEIAYYDNETDNYQQDHFQLHASRQFNPNWTGNLSLHYTYGRGYYEQFRNNDRLSNYGMEPIIFENDTLERTDLVRRRWLDNHFYGTTFSLIYDDFSRWNVTMGGAFNIYNGDHFGEVIWTRPTGNLEDVHRYYENDAVKTEANFYTKAQYRLSNKWSLFGDVQYRYIGYEFEGPEISDGDVLDLPQEATYNFINPKAGINFQPSSGHRFYLFYGMSNREPVRRDFRDSSPESRPLHESLHNVELGYELRKNNFSLGANTYMMYYRNQLVLTGEINDVGGFTRTNIPTSYRSGIELQKNWQLLDWLKWRSNFTFSKNIIEEFEEFYDVYDGDFNWIGMDSRTYENTPIAFSPDIIAGTSLIFEPIENLWIEVIGKYVGRQYLDNTGSEDRSLDPYFVNDLLIQYSLKDLFFREIRFSFKLNNLFDEKYVPNAWIYKGLVDNEMMVLADGYFPQAGRNFMLSLSLRF
ncbi:MAG: TonB-dependent receptor [Chitinophagaceae bacterium]|nr:MAG: TonB-dependent receptor [Chitinophagaceae bacterium]